MNPAEGNPAGGGVGGGSLGINSGVFFFGRGVAVGCRRCSLHSPRAPTQPGNEIPGAGSGVAGIAGRGALDGSRTRPEGRKRDNHQCIIDRNRAIQPGREIPGGGVKWSGVERRGWEVMLLI